MYQAFESNLLQHQLLKLLSFLFDTFQTTLLFRFKGLYAKMFVKETLQHEDWLIPN